ncbi:MAG: hypothetical protein EBR82_41570, partial [Caulobacteraceae bacterium]|nr:hypothetical protein [Caulobacteraceae bacterium]
MSFEVEPRHNEEDFLANFFYTQGRDFPLVQNLHPEEFTDPHLAKIWELVLATQKPNWDYFAITGDPNTFKKLSKKAQEVFWQLLGQGNANPLSVSSLAYQIKTHAKLKLRHQIAELSSGITEDNKQ